MWTRPRIYIGPEQIEPGVRIAVEALAPDVVRVRFSLDEDWTGDPSVFFRIVLSDEAVKEAVRGKTIRRIRDKIRNEVRPDELGLNAYFNFRSFSEEEEEPDPEWT